MTASTSTQDTKPQARQGALFSRPSHSPAIPPSAPTPFLLPRRMLRWTLTACAFAVLGALTHPAWADGGAGGSTSSGAGGTGGGNADASGGGNGGTAASGSLGGGGGGGAGYQAGGSGGAGDPSGSGGGGGGGGTHGKKVTADDSNASPVKGGAGGDGGAGAIGGGGGGGGGAGGYGVVIDGDGLNYTNSGSITGGKGGDGGLSVLLGNGGDGGSGGNGLVFTHSGSLENTGTISGGDGGTGGSAGSGTSGATGSGGAGVLGGNISITLKDNGAISGGMSGDGTTQADALQFTGGDNTLTLEGDGWHLNGNINVLSGSLTFTQSDDQTVANIITGGGTLIQDGGGTLTLTGVNTYTGETWIDEGTLALSGAGSIASSSNVDICYCGAFDISATDNGTTIQDLTGEGKVELGSKTLTVSAAGSLGYDGIIEGDGDLAVTGGGLVLSGNNTYRGGTSIGSYAVVAAASNNALGTGKVSMADTSGLVFFGEDLNLANDFKLSGDAGFMVLGGWTATLSGVISDGASPGTLDYAGGGTLVLTNVNTYTGATVIGADTLALSGAGSIASSSGVEFDSCGCGDGIFDISATDNGATIQSLSGDDSSTVVLGSKTLTLSNASGDYAGTITGTGGLVISGGQEYLTGINTYQGGTTIRGGAMLSVGSDQNLGDPVGGLAFDDGTLDVYQGFNSARSVSLVGNGAFYLDGAGTLGLSGQISGTGGLTVTGDGSGKVVLSHVNTYTGPTQIEAGILALSGAGSIAASSGVDICDCSVFDISASSGGATIQSLSGEGQVKLGGQTLTLSNASGIYAGVISDSGGLVLDGGQETLNSNNTYTGGTTVNAGTLAVGDADHASASIQGNVQVNAAGTLRGHGSIAGDVNSTGIVWPGGSIGMLTVGGNYTQSPDGTLQIEVSPTDASQLKVGGTANLAGTLSLLYGPGTYTDRNYSILSANAINGKFSTITDNNPSNIQYDVVYGTQGVGLDVTALVVAPTQATIFGAMGSSALREGQRVNGLLLDRLADPCVAGGSGRTSGDSGSTTRAPGSDSASSDASVPSRNAAFAVACPRTPTTGLWIQAQGTDTRLDGNHGAPDVRDQHYGFLTGFDRAWRGMTVGLAGGYSHGEISESGNGSRGTLDTLRIAGYAARNLGPYTVAGTLGYAYDFSSTTRSFGALGSARGDGHGQEFHAGLQASRTWQLSPAATLTPRIGLRYAYLDGLGTDESGPTAQNLGVGSQRLQSLQPYVGLTLDYAFTLAHSTRPASLQLRAGYAYETQSTNRNVSVTAADGTGFTIAGTRDTRGLVTVGLGATLPIGKSTNAYLRYDSVLHTGNVNAQALQAGVNYRF